MIRESLVLIMMGACTVWCCCMPKQNEFIIDVFSVATGSPPYMDYRAKYSYDSVNKKIAVQQQGMIIRILDYRNGLIYIINETMKSCNVSRVQATFPSFCTDNWTRVDTEYYGEGGAKLLVDGYSCNTSYANFHSTIQRLACIPVTIRSLSSNSGTAFITTLTFTNLTEGIKDPDVFVPPSYCKKTMGMPPNLGAFDHFLRVPQHCPPW